MQFIIIIVFYFTIFLSPIVIISSSSIIIIWVGLELRTFSFLPIIFSHAYSSFSTIKYFFVQSAGSVIILISLSYKRVLLSGGIFFLALILKIGIAPLHFWLPNFVARLQVKEILILLIWQKIGPLLLITFVPCISREIKIIRGVLRVLVGRIIGLVQTQWKQIFTFSSISHLGWIVIRRAVTCWLVQIYFLVYRLAFLQFILPNNSRILNVSILSFNNLRIIRLLMLLSITGLPPIIGFLIKIFVIFYLSVSRTILVFFYLKIFFSLSFLSRAGELIRRKLFFVRNIVIFLFGPVLIYI